jgi:transcriptional regulator with XRE-family HTH domain
MDKPLYAIRLADLRNKKGFTQQQLAEETNLTRGRLNNYEQGVREPDFKTLETLADFFNVSTDYLLGISNIQNEEELRKMVIKKLTEANLTENQQKALSELLKTPVSEQQNIFAEKFNSLPLKAQKTIEEIMDSFLRP